MRKIGLLLGSFDPPHIGHVWAANYALNYGMDYIFVIPAWQNPWKKNQTSFANRAKMCKLTFDNDEGTIVTLTIDGQYKSHYTYEGLEKLLNNINSRHQEYKDLGYPNAFDYEFYIIGGTDITDQISKWKKGDWILEHFNVLEVPRLGYTESNLGIECSSSILRNMLKEGKSVIPFINEQTLNFIKDNNLYDTEHS